MNTIRAFVPILAIPLTLIAWAFGFRRRIVSHNLEIMEWTKTPWLRFQLCLHAARDLSEFALGYKSPPSVHSRSLKYLEEMRRGPSLLLTAHFHNWEKLGADLRTLGVPLLAAAMPLRNHWANRLLVRWRKRWDLTVVTDHVSRTALTHLTGRGCFAFLWDQDSPGSDTHGQFHGIPVRMNPIPEFLLSKVFCPVYFGVLLPGCVIRLIPLARTGDHPISSLQRRYHRVLESLVGKYPEYWYGFFHARFKNSTRYPGR